MKGLPAQRDWDGLADYFQASKMPFAQACRAQAAIN
jgi:hypothetical protein